MNPLEHPLISTVLRMGLSWRRLNLPPPPEHTRPVLLCTNAAYYPWRGGSEYVLQTIAEFMTAYCDVYVACPRVGRTTLEHNNVRICELNSPYDLPRVIRHVRPDVLFSNMVFNPINYLNLDAIARTPCVKVMNPVGGAYQLDEAWMARTLTRVGEVFDRFIEVDQTSTDYRRDCRYIPHEKIVVIPQGVFESELVDLPSRAQLRREYSIEQPEFFICGQNFWKWKNHRQLLEMFGRFPAPDVALILAGHSGTGDGSLEFVRELARRDNRVHILLDLPRRDFLGLVASSIAHCSASVVEGPQPNIMLECGFLGVPYLTTPAGQTWAYPHVISAETSQLPAEMTRLALDEALRKRLGLEGQRYLRRIGATWKQVLASYRDLFLGLVGDTASRDPAHSA
jgi:glycosyltransferase involved in cell wall biosynthesis